MAEQGCSEGNTILACAQKELQRVIDGFTPVAVTSGTRSLQTDPRNLTDMLAYTQLV